MARTALITGISGQDGPYLAQLLLDMGYTVWGLIRPHTDHRPPSAFGIPDEVRTVQGDLLDQASLIRAVDRVAPDEVYNLGAQSYVPPSWEQAEVTTEVNAIGVLRILEAIRTVMGASVSRTQGTGHIRFYQASSSEMFGKVHQMPQSESTPFHPRSPYGVSKTYGHYITQNYRESFGIHATAGILFNHESPRRGAQFVTRKVSLGVARIKLGLADTLSLGGLTAQRDWGFARDYVRAMHMIINHPTPTDFVIGTGRMHSVQYLVESAFGCVGLNWRDHVVVDPALVRPAEVDVLCADPALAREQLGWEPEKSFEDLVAMMVDADLSLLSSGTAGVLAL
ncbi:GDP-mannose 4,6-dehydratase [Actinomadura madurae]|uniref:GDP-mannose 4,6-dehydratase n=1 Tax=Actinomadura madurae TaxID=1993 RepID=UPI002026A6F7|nr:GDP-mannose 4,6-dehydratase [Actinomadura madurae]MCP9955774.1 GDP-mannose 4,6-dehydratase [Actinomadura madurae]MCP9972512.1 GDP-mannose 4,6-dehydratase [Actinomadura madurae]MCP9985008.1 GDP-mannose 4,6-dehydratase [Actinomadura madurae]MCQ0003421.1 GDP-mannose 4,6-dehydratase [Actinomadura madurae]MCQ0021229.1 GDP-mannose 4,6-dehydratase [Actinomadura madurae]